MPEVRLIDANELKRLIQSGDDLIFDAATERELIYMIDYQPTIEAEPVRRGRWIPDNSHLPSNKFTCSECGNIIKTNHYCRKCYLNYCDNCGAKMDLRTPTEVQLDEADSVMMGGAENG